MASSFSLVTSLFATRRIESPLLTDFQNESGDEPNISFVAAGDFGCNNDAKITIRNMRSLDPNLVIALGDLSYLPSSSCWLNIISPLEKQSDVKISLGYHDIFDGTSALLRSYMNHFGLDRQFYSFNIHNVHFLAMASEVDYLNGSEQYRFVLNDLQRASQDSNIKWIIVYSFRPFYTSPTLHPGPAALRDTYHSMFERYGVDLVLQAHVHNYQRTYPIEYNPHQRSNPIVTNHNTTEFSGKQKGPIFITLGTGGEQFHPILSQGPFVVQQFLKHGFLHVTISGNGSRLTGSFYDNNNRSESDQFTIKK